MSEEKRILEILSEYLQKTDKALDQLKVQQEVNERHVTVLEKQMDVLAMHTAQLGKHDNQILKIQQENQRMLQKLDDNDLAFQSINAENKELLKELLSISRRVGDIEDSKQ